MYTNISVFECAHVHWYLRKTEDRAGSLGYGFTDGGEVPGSVRIISTLTAEPSPSHLNLFTLYFLIRSKIVSFHKIYIHPLSWFALCPWFVDSHSSFPVLFKHFYIQNSPWSSCITCDLLTTPFH